MSNKFSLGFRQGNVLPWRVTVRQVGRMVRFRTTPNNAYPYTLMELMNGATSIVITFLLRFYCSQPDCLIYSDLRRSLDSVKGETEKQAGYHMTLAQQIRTELETPSADFQSKQMHHKKTYLASIEKQVKAKQLQESHVDKAREKYEQDCMKINSYTAQSSLVQGKDLEKIQLKLERARQTVQANEREFANFTRAIESTVQKWEQDWKAFCDGCQDLEEARVDFMKDNMWSYANLVSTVCVADDEVRFSLCYLRARCIHLEFSRVSVFVCR